MDVVHCVPSAFTPTTRDYAGVVKAQTISQGLCVQPISGSGSSESPGWLGAAGLGRGGWRLLLAQQAGDGWQETGSVTPELLEEVRVAVTKSQWKGNP